MGGINHQPTSNISLALTVDAAQSLTEGMSNLMRSNVEIENVVKVLKKP